MIEQLQTGKTIGLSVLAGLIAGGILAGINIALVGPFTAPLSDIALENLMAQGEYDEEEFDAQLQSIHFAQLYWPMLLGIAAGALVGGVFVVGKIRKDTLKIALIIAGIAWFALYVVPIVKYPQSAEATFDPQVGTLYQTLFAGYAAISGLSALGIAIAFRKVKQKEKLFGAAAVYMLVIAVAFFAFPDFHSEDDSLLQQPILNAWRSAISISMTAFWFSLGLIAGLLCRHGT